MSTEFDLCPKCGGVKSLKQPEHTGRVHTSIFRACVCKPEPAQKHDGRLDDRYKVGYGSEWHIQGIRIQASDNTVRGNDLFLLPHRALSLLDWLTQEREKLERLAKEQGQ